MLYTPRPNRVILGARNMMKASRKATVKESTKKSVKKTAVGAADAPPPVAAKGVQIECWKG